MTRIAVIGCGYVGAVSAACFAELGHDVDCIDLDESRIALLSQGRSPIHEPGLEDLLRSGVAAGRLRFSAVYPQRFDASIVFIAVNTPESQEGAADIRAVRDAVATVAPRLAPGSIIVNKSTVPIGTGELVAGMAERAGAHRIAVVSNPEFLREGSAIRDFMHPDRIVLGSDDPSAIDRVAALYAPLEPIIQRTDIRTAEMIKYASNAFLATKISFINEIASICETLGADVEDVARGMGMDARIGSAFLSAGLGWGGSCFPKDVRALAHMAAVHGAHPQLLRSVMEINADQRFRTVQKLRQALGTLEGVRVGILGAAFKANTDDTRNSPALELATLLHHEGAEVAIYDPVVPPDRIRAGAPNARPAATPLAAADGAEALVVATDWPEFKTLDLRPLRVVMTGSLLVDARNCMDPARVRRAGFQYRCVGRPALEQPAPTSRLDYITAAGGQ
ncbi:MAG: UDP-glucose dehydrogenase family protein [Hyphomicrobiales bacterium]